MFFTYSQRDTDDDTEDKFSDLISGADDEIRDKYNAEAELINDDFLLHQLTDNDTEDMCTNDTETAQCEEEEVVTCAKCQCETISEEDLRTPEASDSEPGEDDNLDSDDKDYVVELDELKSITQEEALLFNEL